MKILLAMPMLNTISARTHTDLIFLMFHKIEGVEWRYAHVQDSMTYTARNVLAQKAIEEECDYVLWIDSDMTFPADTLERLLKHDKDFVTGLYFKRRGDHGPVIYSAIDQKGATVYEDYPKDKLFEAVGCGFGMVLMKTDVIRRVASELKGLTFHPFPGLGEDLSFCYRWKGLGGQIWCDPTIKLGHVGEYVFTEEDWENGRIN